MTKPWANDPIVEAPQGNGISAVPLPRNPSEVRREQREEYRTERDFGVDRGDREFDNATKFRNEFRSLPSVTNYNIALGTYNSALKTKPTPEGDSRRTLSTISMMTCPFSVLVFAAAYLATFCVMISRSLLLPAAAVTAITTLRFK